jgi:sugar phosphate isomerase/epimerase
MRIGLVTDGLPELPLEDLLRTAAELGIETLEFGCGNWSAAPHLDLDTMLASRKAREAFLGCIAAHGTAGRGELRRRSHPRREFLQSLWHERGCGDRI